MSESNIVFRVQENQPEEIIRISSDGSIYWRCRLIEAAVLAEREACAKVCEVQQHSWNNAVQCAAAIRNRGAK